MSQQEFPGAYDAGAPQADPATSAGPAEPVPLASGPGPEPLEFPGCRSERLAVEQLEALEEDPKNRFEYWDRDTETVWMVREPAGVPHERPGSRLAQCCHAIGAARGADIECLGATDLCLLDAQGHKRKIMQADQCVYLHPARDRVPRNDGMEVGVHDFPDVVLEVDHTTDIRRGKLKLYEAWGFPEIWAEVPDRYTPSRRPGLRSGVTLWLLGEDGRYRESPVSRAFRGWTASEIHAALNEEGPWTERTCDALDRVGRGLGSAQGTGPDDLPWLRRHRAEGRARGRAEGRAEGEARERARVKALLMDKVLGPEYPRDAPALAGLSDAQVIELLIQCADESELHARLEASRRPDRS